MGKGYGGLHRCQFVNDSHRLLIGVAHMKRKDCKCPNGAQTVGKMQLGTEATFICQIYKIPPPHLSVLEHGAPCPLPDEFLAIVVPEGVPIA